MKPRQKKGKERQFIFSSLRPCLLYKSMMNKNDHKKLYFMICFFCLTLSLLIYRYEAFIPGTPFSAIEAKTYDFRAFYGKKIKADPRLIFLAVDKPSYIDQYPDPENLSKPLQLITKEWPWSREIWALAIERLSNAGAKIIAVDLIFQSEGVGDPEFKKSILKHSDKVILGLNIQTESLNSSMQTTLKEQAITFDYPSRSIIGIPEEKPFNPIWNQIGFVNFFPDPVDHTIRRVHYTTLGSTGEPIHSFAFKILEKLEGVESVKNLPEETLFRLSYNPVLQKESDSYHEEVFLPIPFFQIFDEKIWERNFQSGAFFKDKVILIGVLGDWFQDYHKTSYPTVMPGPKIHLYSLNAAIQKKFLHETSRLADYLTIILSGLIAFALLSKSKEPQTRILALIGVNIAFAGVAYYFFNDQNLVILCFLPFLTFNSSFVLCNIYEIFAETKERARVRSHLERYVSKNVVRMLLENPEKLQGRKAVTILFSDLRGFTTLTESADAEALVKQLNEYLTQMVKCVFQNNGTLDKFIGDAVMAIWGNAETEGSEIDAQRAVQCSLDMIEALKKLNLKWKLEGKPALQVGIGINHGQAIVGNMGSDDKAYERMEFTAIGDSVNTASRIEGLTKDYHTELLLGESIIPFVEKKFQLRSIALVQMKGKTKPTEIFGVLGKINPLAPQPKEEWLLNYEKALSLYRQRTFEEALKGFKMAEELNPEDYLIGEYIHSCEQLIQTPPDENWTGVIIMKTK